MVIANNGQESFEVKVTDGDGLDLTEISHIGKTYVTATPDAVFQVHVRRLHDCDSVSVPRVSLSIDGVDVGYFHSLRSKNSWHRFVGFRVNREEKRKFVFYCPKYGDTGIEVDGYGESEVGKLKIVFEQCVDRACPGADCSKCRKSGHGDSNLPDEGSEGQRKEAAELKQKDEKKFFWYPSIFVKAGPTFSLVKRNHPEKQKMHTRLLPNSTPFSISLQCETEGTLRLRNILPRLITATNDGSSVPVEGQANQGRKRGRLEGTAGTLATVGTLVTVKRESTTNPVSPRGTRTTNNNINDASPSGKRTTNPVSPSVIRTTDNSNSNSSNNNNNNESPSGRRTANPVSPRGIRTTNNNNNNNNNNVSPSGGRGGKGSSDIIDLTEDDGGDDITIWKLIKCPKREVVSL